MKKIGIITINDYNNLGNRLQNYATQEVLKSLGCEPLTIVNSPYKKKSIIEMIKQSNLNTLIKQFYKLFKIARRKLYKNKKEINLIIMKEQRIKAFKEFTNKYIGETNYIISQDNIPQDIGGQYDAFVVGSDQVWNPNFRFGSTIDFLTFAPKNKRIAFSPSFGISTLPIDFTEKYKLWISEMEYLSVREEAGAKIIYDLTGRKADVLVDPTLMLDKNKWLTIATPSRNKPDNPYLLTYFLGQIPEDVNKFITKVSLEYKLEVIHMANINDSLRYSTDPGEFLAYINSSELFFTDSFHGAVFSILFERPFIICDRVSKTQSMNSRIETLLTKFQLEDRKWGNIKRENNIFEVNFSHISKILEAERQKSFDYLRKALNIKEEN